MTPTFWNHFRTTLQERLQIKNTFAVPRITKITLNVGASEAVASKGVLQHIEKQLALIAGQKPVITKARKSISAFKIRKGLPIGAMVTLRGVRMQQFLEKMVKIVIPRLKDFRGISPNIVDRQGNATLGFKEQTLFPEIDFDGIDKLRGLQVVISTTARDQQKGRVLFEALGIPFTK